MAMPFYRKLFWKAKNLHEVYWKQRNVSGLGCLEHRSKKTDIIFGWEIKSLVLLRNILITQTLGD